MGLRDRFRAWGAEARAIGEASALAEAGRAEELLRFVSRHGLGPQRVARAAFAGGVLEAPGGGSGSRLPAAIADEDALLDAMAAVRGGEPSGPARERLVVRDARSLRTAFGVRFPARALAVSPLAARFDIFLPDLTLTRAAAREELRRRLGQYPGDTTAWLRLAALRHPEDARALAEARVSSGRRADHALLDAVAVAGGEPALPALRAALQARDVDPGRGFTQRRLAADGLGRLGLRAGLPLLLRALNDERADFEGRPGAGLGVQYPVRANLLWALGELGCAEAIPALVAVLGETSGSAFGGFYLPAMDALVRLGAASVPALEATAAGKEPIAAANALGALEALGARAPT